MPGHVRDSGTWKEADWFAKVAGSWVQVQQGYTRQGGVWVPFYTAEVVVVAPTSLATQNVATLFNSYESGLWASTKKKRLIVNSHIGPLLLNSAFGGGLTIEVQSGATVSGLGGSAGVSGVGGAGGHALNITAGTDIVVINNGIIRGGGGGGGRGGQGGAGETASVVREPATGDMYSETAPTYGFITAQNGPPPPPTPIAWDGGNYSDDASITDATTQKVGTDGNTYFRGAFVRQIENTQTGRLVRYYRIWREVPVTTPTTGGLGGSGGRGQGADGAAASGAAGAAGGTNAGTGGTGGAGGAYGTAGSTGNTGGNGNVGIGASGSSGGAAGRSISGYNRVNYSGTGSLVGPTANT